MMVQLKSPAGWTSVASNWTSGLCMWYLEGLVWWCPLTQGWRAVRLSMSSGSVNMGYFKGCLRGKNNWEINTRQGWQSSFKKLVYLPTKNDNIKFIIWNNALLFHCTFCLTFHMMQTVGWGLVFSCICFVLYIFSPNPNHNLILFF